MVQQNTKTNFKRQVYRLPRTDIPPLYNQRLNEYNARVNELNLNKPRVEVLNLQEINQEYESFETVIENGVRLYGYLPAIQQAENELMSLLASGKRRGSIDIPTQELNKSFAIVVQELNELLDGLNAIVVNSDESQSIIEFEVLGDLALHQVKADAMKWVQDMIIEARTIPLPKSWNQNINDDTIKIVELNRTDDEYKIAAECFLTGFNPAQIICIERVQNPNLYREYYKSKRTLSRKYNGNPNELLLKHGTRTTNPSSIWNSGDHTNTYGFDPRYCDKGLFGRGAYFAEDTSYSHNYAYSVPNSNHKQMFLASVLVGSCDQKPEINKEIRHPTPPHDSVRGPITSSNQGIIIYELHRSYPTYLVTYQK